MKHSPPSTWAKRIRAWRSSPRYLAKISSRVCNSINSPHSAPRRTPVENAGVGATAGAGDSLLASQWAQPIDGDANGAGNDPSHESEKKWEVRRFERRASPWRARQRRTAGACHPRANVEGTKCDRRGRTRPSTSLERARAPMGRPSSTTPCDARDVTERAALLPSTGRRGGAMPHESLLTRLDCYSRVPHDSSSQNAQAADGHPSNNHPARSDQFRREAANRRRGYLGEDRLGKLKQFRMTDAIQVMPCRLPPSTCATPSR